MISIQQATASALQAYLQARMPDVDVSDRWPNGDKRLPPKAISILMAGRRRDFEIQPHIVAIDNLTFNRGDYTWGIKFITQPLQLDVWATSDIDRDDILARLDDFLNAGATSLVGALNVDPVENGLILQLDSYGWPASIADYEIGGPYINDSPNSIARDEFRATVEIDASALLTVTRTSARQRLIHLAMQLNEEQQTHVTDFTKTTTNYGGL